MRSGGDANDLSLVLDAHHPHALRVAAYLGYLFDKHSYYSAVIGNDHHVVLGIDELHIDEPARLFVERACLDALAGARLKSELLDIDAFSETVAADCEHVAFGTDYRHVDDIIVGSELHCAHALGIPAHEPDVLLGEAYALAGLRRDEYLVDTAGMLDGNKLVVVHELYRDLADLAYELELGERRLFYHAALGRHNEVALVLVVLDRNDRAYLFPVAELEQVDDRPAARGAFRLGYLVSLGGVHSAVIGEVQQRVVRVGHEHVFDEVLFLRTVRRDALAAAVLSLIFGRRQTLDVAVVRHGNDDVLFLYEVGYVYLVVVYDKLAAARVVVLLLYLLEFRLDYIADALGTREYALEIRYLLIERGQLVLQRVYLEARQAAQLHFEYRVRLLVGEVELRHELFRRLDVVAALLDDLDDLVDVRLRLDKPLDYVRALLRGGEVVARAPDDYFELMLEIQLEHLFEVEDLRFAVGEREEGYTRRDLQVGVLVESVENDLRLRVALDFYYYAHARTVGFFLDVGDALDALILDEVGYLDYQFFFIDLVRQLGNDYALTHKVAALADGIFLYLRFGADNDAALARFVRALDVRPAHDKSARRIVGRGQVLHQVFYRYLGIVDERVDGVDDLAEVVRRDIGRHTDGYTVRAVDEQVGEARRQDRRLLQRVVEVVGPVDRFFVDIAEQLVGYLGQARLGIPLRRGRIAVDRAEVTVTVDERHAHGEVLRKTHERVVHRRVAVRVELTEHVADYTRALAVRLVRPQTELAHSVYDTAVDRFKTVANVRYRARNVDRHRVRNKAFLHFVDNGRRKYLGIVYVILGRAVVALIGTYSSLSHDLSP